MKTSLGVIERHAKLRWVGAPLLVTGLGLIGLCVADWLQGGSGYSILLGTLGTGMGLAAFGANHEAVIALAARHAESEEAPLPESLSQELSEELARDRAGTMALQAFPRTAMALPVVAIGVQALTAWIILS